MSGSGIAAAADADEDAAAEGADEAVGPGAALALADEVALAVFPDGVFPEDVAEPDGAVPPSDEQAETESAHASRITLFIPRGCEGTTRESRPQSRGIAPRTRREGGCMLRAR